MGYSVLWQPDAGSVYLSCGHDNLALHAASGEEPLPDRDHLDHVGLAVAKAEDVDAWADYLDGRSVPLHARPKQHRDGARSLYLREPGGVLVQIIYHPSVSQ
jgi:hypothetical protein